MLCCDSYQALQLNHCQLPLVPQQAKHLMSSFSPSDMHPPAQSLKLSTKSLIITTPIPNSPSQTKTSRSSPIPANDTAFRTEVVCFATLPLRFGVDKAYYLHPSPSHEARLHYGGDMGRKGPQVLSAQLAEAGLMVIEQAVYCPWKNLHPDAGSLQQCIVKVCSGCAVVESFQIAYAARSSPPKEATHRSTVRDIRKQESIELRPVLPRNLTLNVVIVPSLSTIHIITTPPMHASYNTKYQPSLYCFAALRAFLAALFSLSRRLSLCLSSFARFASYSSAFLISCFVRFPSLRS